jgi:hypothetical protein
MKLNKMIALGMLTGILALASEVRAQEDVSPLSFDIRGAYGVPFGEFENDVDNDFGYGVSATYTFTPAVGVYAGWARDSFGCANILCADESQVHVSGLEVGAKFIIDSDMVATPWLKAGLIAHQAEFDGEVVNFETERAYGFQAAAGVDYPLGRVISLSPALRLKTSSCSETQRSVASRSTWVSTSTFRGTNQSVASGRQQERHTL